MDQLGLGYDPKHMTLVYDENRKDGGGTLYRCPECKSGWYGGGRAMHHGDCSKTDYTGVHMLIGPKDAERIQQLANEYGVECDWHQGISMQQVEQLFQRKQE